MKKNLILILLPVIVFLVLSYVIYKEIGSAKTEQPAGSAFEPSASPLTPSIMTEEQKRAAIEIARRDAAAAARASGQPDEEAYAAGEAMAEAARRAMFRASTAGAD